MMKNLKYFILALMMVTLLVACHDDDDFAGQDVEFCVRAAWQNGLGDGVSTRALTATSILANGTEDIVINNDDYPATINVHCSDGTDFILEKSVGLCAEHNDYWQYTPSVIYKDRKIIRDELDFTATAVIDDDNDPETTADGDRLEGSVDKNGISGHHMLLTLHHTKALVRFAFKVDARYDKIRFIRLTGIELNDAPCVIVDKVLNKDNLTLIGYAYVDPDVVTTEYVNTIKCTYNIYDKDAVFPTESMTQAEVSDAETELLKHLDRAGVVAQNTFTFNKVKDAGGNEVSKIEAGYYYDLKVTLNPDYLYVLSEHDNKHITIN